MSPSPALESRPSAEPPHADLERLHPALWRARGLGGASVRVTASGFAELDAQLPGGGWPHGVLTELLLPHPGLGEMRLLAPALAVLAQAAGAARTEQHGTVMLFDPPAALYGWALGQLGVDAAQLLVVHSRAGACRAARPSALRRLLPGADLLWALEQALQSGHVAAVLAWLPAGLPAEALRRLQLAAQSHDGPAFVLREIGARNRPSAAPLRLALQAAGIDTLSVRVLKRRGPPLAQPLKLALQPVLSLRLRQRAGQRIQPASPAAAALPAL